MSGLVDKKSGVLRTIITLIDFTFSNARLRETKDSGVHGAVDRRCVIFAVDASVAARIRQRWVDAH